MAEYCTEDDLLKIRPDIMSLGVDFWDDQIEEAGQIIDRALDSQWYRTVADSVEINWREYPFDRDLLLNAEDQLTRLGCYKTLELAYLYLMKNRADDAFEVERKLFRTMYNDELVEVLRVGLDYDWDEDDEIAPSESSVPHVRRLLRA
jgi:hypothetical protein